MSDAATVEHTAHRTSTGSVAYSATIADFASAFRLADAPAKVVGMAQRSSFGRSLCVTGVSSLKTVPPVYDFVGPTFRCTAPAAAKLG